MPGKPVNQPPSHQGTIVPFVDNNGIRIHYQSIGSGPALLLVHATLGSGADWADLGYVDALKEARQLILPDLRGHGESDKPHDPAAYDPALRAADVLAVLDDLGIRNADFFGYSLGGWVGFELAKRAPDRFNSFVFGGAHPYAEDMQAFRAFMPRDPAAFAAIINQLGGSHLPPKMRARWLANDLEAIRTLTQDRESNAAVLASITLPCLLFAGERDPRLAKVTECAAALPNATIFTLPECDHVGALARSDLVIPHFKRFLSNAGL